MSEPITVFGTLEPLSDVMRERRRAHPMIYGRVQAGQVSIELNCDTTQLDEAVAKMDLLIAKIEHAQSLGVNLGMLTPMIGGAVLAASPRAFSRRRLFRFWK